jgi:hypothetical protein
MDKNDELDWSERVDYVDLDIGDWDDPIYVRGVLERSVLWAYRLI